MGVDISRDEIERIDSAIAEIRAWVDDYIKNGPVQHSKDALEILEILDKYEV